MPPPFAPFNFDKSARKSRGGALRQERGAAIPPFMQSGARTQKKWVGSPPAMLPPDGDYPGGSTGIQQDGAFPIVPNPYFQTLNPTSQHSEPKH